MKKITVAVILCSAYKLAVMDAENNLPSLKNAKVWGGGGNISTAKGEV